MKKIKNIINAVLIFSIIGLISCEKLVDGINIDPTAPLDAPASAMLSGVLVGNMSVQEGELARISGLWSGYFVGLQQQYQAFQQYIVTARIFDDNWQRVYSGTLKNVKILKQKATAVNNIRMLGVAQVIEANLVGTAADLWGDIPYTQVADSRYPNPVYDKQSDVYRRVQLLLDSAITNLRSTSFESFAAQDIHFAGDNNKWIQTANTLKARYFLHTKEYDKALAAANAGISSAANNWIAPHSIAGTGSFNSYFQFVAQQRPGWMNAAGTLGLALLNPADRAYRGHAKTIERSRLNFLFTTTNLNTTATGFFGQTASFPLATFAENMLIIAETETRLNGFDKGLARLNAYRLYMNTGGYIGTTFLTTGNFRYDPLLAVDFASGGIENPTTRAISVERALLREILEERYVTFIGTIEGFNDVRRTLNEADVRVPVLPNTGTKFPQRLLYPQIEVDLNTSTPNPIPDLFTPTAVNK
jgi:hypothetical protein